MTTDDDDRIAYLTGEGGGSLSASERADLDELRAVLRDPSVWAEPPAALEDAVVSAIAAEAQVPQTPAQARRRTIRRRPALQLAALATAALAALAVVVGTRTPGPAPQRFAMVVTGTYLAPGVHGSASLTKMPSGWAIKLSATGLPLLSNGRYYEAWLKNAAGTLVPVGTFNDARQVTLWSGVPVTQFPTLTVTEQRIGNPKSSGLRVLVGTIQRTR